MSFLIVRSVPLSEETRNAWKNVGGTFLKRSRNGRVPNAIVDRYRYILNLGNLRLDVDTGIVIFNEPEVMRAVSRPLDLRETLGELDVLPENTIKGPHWHKNPGWRGRGKVFHENILGECAVTPGDVQKHVEGTEYRVISVGDLIVQAHRKEHDGNPLNGFEWYWCGVDAIRRNGIIPTIKEAMASVPSGTRTVLGWDIIVGSNRPYIIEVNTSPGVNDATAQRIVNAIERSL